MKKTPIVLFSLIMLTTSLILTTVSAQSWNISGNNNATGASKLGTTNVVPLRFFTNNSERILIDPSGNVGIGTSTPLNKLTVQLSGSVPAPSWLSGGSSLPAFIGFGEEMATGFNLATAANASGYRPVLNTRRSRGTLAAPAVVKNNDYLASFVSSGYDGTTFQNPATIDFYVDGVPSAGNVPGRISFVTGTNASNRLERLKVGSTGNFTFNDGQVTIIQATGNLGIGTTNPGHLLDVAGRMRVRNGGSGLTAGAWLMNEANNSDIAFVGLPDDNSVGFYGSAGAGWGLAMNLTSGKVGLGTLAPTARLHVVGAASETTPVIHANVSYVGNVDVRGISVVSKSADGYGYGVDATGGYRGGYFFGNGGAYTGGVIGVQGVATGTAGTRYGVYGSASGGTENWGGYFTTKTYTSELRVGGTTGAAGYVAAINGRLIATEVRVELIANWPDYVFNKGYKLMPIEELEASINAEKHLPGIPAASEMKENGIMLGEMQTKTIEKVEENTLYIIQLNNKIKLLEADKAAESTLLNNKIKLLEAKIDELTKKMK